MIDPTSFQQTRDSVGTEPDVYPIPIRYILNLKEYQTLKITRRRLTDVAIYGNSDLGIYGTSEYHTSETENFVLGNPTFGVLGSSKLGDNGITETIMFVVNQNNIFREQFDENSFIDTTNSTGSLTNSTYVLDDGEVLQSEIIAKSNTSFSNVTLYIDSTDDDNLDLYVTQDGTNWESVSNNNEHTFINNGTYGIKYKIENNSGSSITINNIKILYR